MVSETGGLRKMAAPPRARQEALRAQAWAEESHALETQKLGALALRVGRMTRASLEVARREAQVSAQPEVVHVPARQKRGA